MTHEIDLVKFGAALKAKRGNTPLREATEEIGGVSKSHLSCLERGLAMPDLDLYVRLCRWMEVNVTGFLVPVEGYALKFGETSDMVAFNSSTLSNRHEFLSPVYHANVSLTHAPSESKIVSIFDLEARLVKLEALISQHFPPK